MFNVGVRSEIQGFFLGTLIFHACKQTACPHVVGKYLILHRAMQEPDFWSHLLNSSPAVYIPVALP